jgi:enterochelin esterase-like enzyme
MVMLLGPFEIVPGVPPARHVRVHVPKRAAASERPLLVLFDGQNVFDDAPSFSGGWHTHAIVDRMARRSNPPVIVAVDHGHEQRIGELSPFPVMGHAPAIEPLLHWIAEWLLPQLRTELSITNDRRRVIVGGSSMGGLAALYALLRRPDVFGGALAMSPSLWVGKGALLRLLSEVAFAPGSRVYVDAGRHEAGGTVLGAVHELEHIVKRHPHVDVRLVADPRGHHRESSWRRRLPAALRYHFDVGAPPTHPHAKKVGQRRFVG